MGIRIYGLGFVCAALLASASLPALADALTDRAKQLLAQKQGKQAYELLLPQEGTRAGDPEFDHLLGIAALEVGEAERAVFALERVLAVQPTNHVARADIARAYLALGERETARREFATVRAQRIPDDVKATIDKFLSAIEAADVTQISGYLEAGGGYDSNVNFATSSGQIALPGILGNPVITLGQNATRRADYFTTFSGGANLTHRLTREWSIVANAAALAKINAKVRDFDTVSYEGSAGARWGSGKHAVTAGVQAQNFELDWARFREARGLVGQWQYSLDDRRQLTAFAQAGELRYPTQSARNALRQVLGLGYGHGFDGNFAPILFVSAYGGREKEMSSGVPELGHQLVGARAGLQMRLAPGWTAFGNAAYERRRYGGPEPLFAETRNDRQVDLGGGVGYAIRPGTTLIGQVAHTNTASNIVVNRYKRTVGTVSVRMNF